MWSLMKYLQSFSLTLSVRFFLCIFILLSSSSLLRWRYFDCNMQYVAQNLCGFFFSICFHLRVCVCDDIVYTYKWRNNICILHTLEEVNAHYALFLLHFLLKHCVALGEKDMKEKSHTCNDHVR